MAQEVKVKRTLLPTPTIDDPERKIYQIEYQAGELPPHFVYITEKEWTKEKEAAAIKADIKKRVEAPSETISI
jgi:hypothetical protein